MTLTIAGAFLVGLVGSGVHCLGMCGGIASALAMGTSDSRRWLAPLLNSAGRVSTYIAGGAVVGALGWSLVEGLGLHGLGRILTWFTGALFVLMGLSLAFTLPGLQLLERAGARVWARMRPLAQRSFQLRGPLGAYAAGLIWGWLPCGLVYTMLAAAAASASPLTGAMLMGSFGVGTSLAMAATGYAAGAGAASLPRRVGLRRAAGALLIILGLWVVLAHDRLMHAHTPAGAHSEEHVHHHRHHPGS